MIKIVSGNVFGHETISEYFVGINIALKKITVKLSTKIFSITMIAQTVLASK